VDVRLRVWDSGVNCTAPPTTDTRVIPLVLMGNGDWTIVASRSMAQLTVTVNTKPIDTCFPPAPGESCQTDCQCPNYPSERCLGGFGRGGPFRACATPGEVDRDCGASRCTSVDDGLANVCDPSAPIQSCPPAYELEPSLGRCAPTFMLGVATRVPC